MRRLATTVAATIALLAMLVAPVPVSANNDPHRSYFPNPPFDLDTTFCPFPVHVESPFQAEYGRTSTLPDGSTVIKVTGPLFTKVTNVLTGMAVTVSSSSAGSITIAPDGSSMTYVLHGRSMIYGPNLTAPAIGLPSNVVSIAGTFVGTLAFAPDGTFTWTSVAGHFRVLTDFCAAVS